MSATTQLKLINDAYEALRWAFGFDLAALAALNYTDFVKAQEPAGLTGESEAA